MKLSGLELIKAYREHPEQYLPMLDHTWQTPGRNEYGEVNIGWNAGLLEQNRPFFVECWAAYQATFLTIFVSSKGIEDKTPAELEKMFLDAGYYSYRTGKHYDPQVDTLSNPKKGDFFSITITIGTEDEPAMVDGAMIYVWSVLNEYNQKHGDEET